MTPFALPAALTVAIISRFDPPELQQSERLRFRGDLCKAWHSASAERLFLVIGGVDHAVKWEIEIESLAEGSRIATVRSFETFEVLEPTENDPFNSGAVDGKPEQTYDTLDLLIPGTNEPTPGDLDCDAVGRGKLVPRLRFLKTGRDQSF